MGKRGFCTPPHTGADRASIYHLLQLVPWAYKRQCGIAAYTVARACIGKPGIADGCE
jgi:hypothetical protein